MNRFFFTIYLKLMTLGRYRLRGVAGSGKTMVLAYRAAKLASQGYKILILTFNITLWHFIKDVIARAPFQFDWRHITLNHFHGFCHDIIVESGEPWPQDSKNDPDELFHSTVPKLVEDILSGRITTKRKLYEKKWDAILIDEGQDYYQNWYDLLCKFFLTERNELLLLCDVRQNIYSRELIWTDGEMSGFKGRWRELNTVFRLPPTIAEQTERFCSMFGLESSTKTEDFGQTTFFKPHLIWLEILVTEQKHEIPQKMWKAFEALKMKGMSASDIVFLLPDHYLGSECVKFFEKKNIQVCHVFGIGHKKAFWLGDSRLKMSTIHSFKGWEMRNVVIYIPPPSKNGKDTGQLDKLLYTAMTRTKENLIVFNAHSRYSEFGSSLPKQWIEVEDII